MKLETIDIDDKAKWYETRRNELLALLERTTAIEQIPEDFPDELKDLKGIQKKCQEDQFEIVLVSEFQGGKSTTFNALCDGRDLSPRGLGGGGIKTSAAKISAQNISDGETREGMDEWAELTFKNKRDIQLSMFDILHSPLARDPNFHNEVIAANGWDDQPFFANISTSEGFAKLLDLDNPVHRDAVRRALKSLWGDGQTRSNEDTLDQLRIATLMERFYGTPEYEQLRQRTLVGIYDFQKMVVFPKDWEIRWMNGEDCDFTFEEAAFVFIAEALLRIKSDSLARLGCRITDCPGLHANPFDTAVAKDAIVRSDAVWYLIGGDKQIGEVDLESLEEIKDMHRRKTTKVTCSVNLRGEYENAKDTIFPVTKSTIRNRGFDFPLLPYHARFAFLAAQCRRICGGKPLTDFEIECMKADLGKKFTFTDPRSGLEKLICKLGFMTDIEEIQNIDSISDETVEVLSRYSNIEELMKYLSEEIISKKSRAILVDNGSRSAIQVLEGLEGKLKAEEDLAVKGEKEWKRKRDEAEKKLNNFKKIALEKISDSSLNLRKNTNSQDMAKEFVELILDEEFLDYFADRIVENYYKVKNEPVISITFFPFFDLFRGFSIDDAKMVSRVMEKCGQPMAEFYKNKVIAFCDALMHDEESPSAHWRDYTDEVALLIRRIKQCWEEICSKQDYVGKLSLKLPDHGTLTAPLKKFQDSVLQDEKLQGIFKLNFWEKWFPLLSSIVSGIWNFFTGTDPKEKMRDRIKEQMSEKLGKSQLYKDMVADYTQMLLAMHINMIEEFKKSVNNLSTDFKKLYITPAKAKLSEKEDERRQIAARNREIREKQIVPLRAEIQEFEQQVTAELAEL